MKATEQQARYRAIQLIANRRARAGEDRVKKEVMWHLLTERTYSSVN